VPVQHVKVYQATRKMARVARGSCFGHTNAQKMERGNECDDIVLKYLEEALFHLGEVLFRVPVLVHEVEFRERERHRVDRFGRNRQTRPGNRLDV
jgi:hypothetical protein